MTPLRRDAFWIFGYGSLMWRPGFTHAEARPATLRGYRRSFCLRSVIYRGTETAPGLVLALKKDPNAECRGVAFRIEAAEAEAAHRYLRERELVTDAYEEISPQVALDDGAEAEAVTYAMRLDHPQYEPTRCLDARAAIIAKARGCVGENAEYLFNTQDSLSDMGVEDSEIIELCARVRRLQAAAIPPRP